MLEGRMAREHEVHRFFGDSVDLKLASSAF